MAGLLHGGARTTPRVRADAISQDVTALAPGARSTTRTANCARAKLRFSAARYVRAGGCRLRESLRTVPE